MLLSFSYSLRKFISTYPPHRAYLQIKIIYGLRLPVHLSNLFPTWKNRLILQLFLLRISLYFRYNGQRVCLIATVNIFKYRIERRWNMAAEQNEKAIYNITLNQPLEAGTYKAVMKYNCFSRNGSQLNGSNLNFNLIVEDKDND